MVFSPILLAHLSVLYLCQETLRCTAASKYKKGNPTLFLVTIAIMLDDIDENSRERFKLKSILHLLFVYVTFLKYVKF